MDATDGGNKLIVSTHSTNANIDYTWSEDSSKIIFVGDDNNLYMVNADGTGTDTTLVDNFVVTSVSASYKTVCSP